MEEALSNVEQAQGKIAAEHAEMELRLQGVVASLDSERQENSRLHEVMQAANATHSSAVAALQTTIDATKQVRTTPKSSLRIHRYRIQQRLVPLSSVGGQKNTYRGCWMLGSGVLVEYLEYHHAREGWDDFGDVVMENRWKPQAISMSQHLDRASIVPPFTGAVIGLLACTLCVNFSFSLVRVSRYGL